MERGGFQAQTHSCSEGTVETPGPQARQPAPPRPEPPARL